MQGALPVLEHRRPARYFASCDGGVQRVRRYLGAGQSAQLARSGDMVLVEAGEHDPS
ncbi:hypothetical protein [Streptomyces sp. NBC_00882]|uniref:hypothetical protein n=1 Tax=Streptomyces sp. NBC_00882 TaxID=2975856 RepID=UPI003869BC7F